MNKFKLIIILFVFIIIFVFLGAFFIQADEKIKEEEDILNYQNKITSNINVYGYSIDNPNIIINPYNENYNSALILFETDDYVSIEVNINNKNIYNTKKTNRHYIGVYNLLKGVNEIVLSYGNKSKTLEIIINEEGNTIDLENAILLSNNHLLLPTYKYINNNVYTGFREVDALGKIYYEYLLEDGYKGIACEIDSEKLAILSEDLLIIDRQNGNIISNINIQKYKINWLYMEYIEEKIILYGKNIVISVDLNGEILEIEKEYSKQYLNKDINYNINTGVRFYNEIETKISNKNILLFNYSKKMNYDIEIKKEFNRIVVNREKVKDKEVYIILDKFLDKKVYKLDDNINYIYTYNLKGKYSIYFKIGNKVYKSGKYIEV